MSVPRKTPKPPTIHTDLRLEVWKPVFTAELAALISKHGIEVEANFPATLLADYFLVCLNNLAYMNERRSSYHRLGWHPVILPSEEPGA
jgi:hypothetical protein